MADDARVSPSTLAGWILNPRGDAEPNWPQIRTDNPLLEQVVRDVGGKSAAFLHLDAPGGPSSSDLARRLEQRFPGRDGFCRRLAATLDGAIDVFRMEASASFAADDQISAKPNILILGGQRVGKTYLLNQVLPAVLPAYLKNAPGSATHGAFVAYVDVRHLKEQHRLLMDGFGPVQCARMLVASGSEDLEAWGEGLPVMVCLDHLESVWEKRGEDRGHAVDPLALAAALAQVIRGVRCSLPRLNSAAGGLNPHHSVATHKILFAAVAHLGSLRSVVEKRVGEAGTCEVTPADLVDAGMPAALAGEFPVILPLPAVAPHAFRKLLEDGKHPGFLALDRLARALRVAGWDGDPTTWVVEYEPAAVEAIFRLTWGGAPDFTRLGQVLAGLAALLPEIAIPGQPLRVTADYVVESLLRNFVLPGEVS